MINPPIPQFTSIDDAIRQIQTGTKHVSIILLGTIWSPPCRYTFYALQEVMESLENNDEIQAFYVDQDASVQFCYTEGIPIGFPTIIVFALPNEEQMEEEDGKPYFLFFIPEGQVYDQNKSDQLKSRLIRQLNQKQLKHIIDESLEVYKGKKYAISSPI
ncbi:hypothetical protein TVAG_368950 [Trichomonas vaginalis G3]|uniref:Thioredoxin domain-containing protein n=1 Tax=Trichomonas vaginalis (strain ATCC PRA-98 / G3) TaxID=412133 RepID=A2EV00_TRIV3|nr:thioredoxin-like family [Trichomonas vaginalis G3]EAY03523.1 hypothetical protein TVAG_368950 [Trichomonas vaginalis G3]KAI5537496.1 thioredoxin-like family [Trichomonas vaginalis G3]|eukprot:XP_001315746.1 hypothetical protein [Trichomonas vaginalis G3]